MAMVNLHAAKKHLFKLVDQAAAGEEIVIVRSGKPVACLVPLEPSPSPQAPEVPRVLGLLKGSLVIPDDFDAPLPDDLLALFEEKAG